MEQITLGNLTIACEIQSKDIFGEIASSMNNMIDQLRQLITSVQDIADNVSSSSQFFTRIADQQAGLSHKIALSMQTLAIDANNNLDSFTKAKSSSDQIATGITQVTHNSERVHELADQVVRTSEEGKAAVQDIQTQMYKIRQIVTAMNTTFTMLNETSQQISSMTTLITDISNQTNLLALNAAIEAARAGEHGRSFSVVAEQVRQLADQSSGSASEIIASIQLIRTEIQEATSLITSCSDHVESGVQKTEKADMTFESVYASIQFVLDQVVEASNQSKKVASESSSVTAIMDKIHESTYELSITSQETATISQEQASSMHQITTSAEKLEVMIQHLHESLEKFKITA
jgi:methyl-accepting chemotaxis protein